MSVKLSAQHDFREKAAPVHIEVLADTPEEALDTLEKIVSSLVAGVPVQTVAQIAKPVSTAEAKADPSKSAQHAHDKAMRLLVDLYRDEKTRGMARALLTKYQVNKFGEIPTERGDELLADAQAIKG